MKTETKHNELAQRVGHVCAACSLVAWALLTILDNPPETESQRMELYQGMSFVMDTTNQILTDVYQELNKD